MERRDFHKLVVGSALGGCIARTESGVAPVRRGQRVRELESVLRGVRSREGAGFPVRRPFPVAGVPQFDPFVLLDEMGPVDWPPGEAKGAPDHPHRGFETVTYVLRGAVEHRDSFGGRGLLGPGDVQWMTAGSGLVHSEMPPQSLVDAGGPMHGFQLWVNLPARQKWTRPRYQELSSRHIARDQTSDGRSTVRVIAGRALGARGTTETHTPISYHHWTLAPGADVRFDVPEEQRVALSVFGGSLRIGDGSATADDGTFAVLGQGESVRMRCDASRSSPAEVLLLAGAPIGEPIARWGPFVMNTDAEIQQAVDDYRAGRMGTIPRSG